MNIKINDINNDVERAVRDALAEDIRDGDITAELIPEEQHNDAVIIARESCVLCGQAWLEETYKQLGGLGTIEWLAQDGEQIKANTPLVKLRGNTRRLLTGERTALNFLQLLSGTATLSNQYARQLGESHIKLLDTRKTIPGLRTAQKYAVATGGCHNHRIGLFDAFLIKENHIAACGSIGRAVQQARTNHPKKPVEVEVEGLSELEEALSVQADIIMLDNFSQDQLVALSDIDKGRSQYELSGNLTIDNLSSIKDYNIDFISFGALTKNVKAIDLSFRII